MNFLTITLTLLLIMNPFGNMKYFLNLLEGVSPKRRKFIIFREMLMALAFMYFFSFLGERLASFLSINQTACLFAAGIILLLVAIKIIFPPKDDYIPRVHGEEPFLVPIAIPIVASQALLATIMLYAQVEVPVWPMTFAIFVAWAISAVLLVGSHTVLRIIGGSGLIAIERLMGIVLILIAVQRFMEGVLFFMSQRQ